MFLGSIYIERMPFRRLTVLVLIGLLCPKSCMSGAAEDKANVERFKEVFMELLKIVSKHP